MKEKHAVVVAAVVLVALAAVALPCTTPAAAEGSPGHVMVSADQLEWRPVPSLPAGARIAVLEGDPTQAGPITMRLELPANYVIPAHTHPVVERVTVLSGTFYLGLGDTFDRERAHALAAGGLAVMDPGLAMYAFTGDEPSVIQINGEGPWGITYLDPAQDPRRQQE